MQSMAMECSENVAHHMTRASPTASGQDAAGAIASITPTIDKKASRLTGKVRERSQSLEMRAVFECTNLTAFQMASPTSHLHNPQGTTSEREGFYSLEDSLFCFKSE